MPRKIKFPPPTHPKVDLLCLVWEPSADSHAASMIRGARTEAPELNICAFGGPKTAAAGAQLIHETTASGVNGVLSVALKYWKLKRFVKSVIHWIESHRPKAICFVDSAGLNLRLADILRRKRLIRNSGGAIRTFYYIGPQLWVTRAHRRFSMNANMEALGSIMPMDLPFYEGLGMKVELLEHPCLALDYKLPFRYDPEGPLLLAPGSRVSEVHHQLPIFCKAFARLRDKNPSLRACIRYPNASVREALERKLKASPELKNVIELQPSDAPVSACAAILKIGTSTLEATLAGIPHVCCIRADAPSAWLARRLAYVDYLALENRMLGQRIFPEFHQEQVSPEHLSEAIQQQLQNPKLHHQVLKDAEKLRAIFAKHASRSASDWLVHQLR